MSPQHSNRSALIEGTIRCLDALGVDKTTARAITKESGANLASITYHFGSKDALVTEAIVTGLDRWLDEIATRMESGDADDSWTRFEMAAKAIADSREAHSGLAGGFVTALAHAQHNETVRKLICEGVRRTRPEIARLIGFGDDQVGSDAGGLVLSMFFGLLFQLLLDADLAIEGPRLGQAMLRISNSIEAGGVSGQSKGGLGGTSSGR